ncbi:hypothetical protein H9L39_19403 [Fusarium oxysporum f. sp. albedinis]|nr:hypothetical protein H9L39_19403 [Fusarium oxysporum f. sp. albedinis]
MNFVLFAHVLFMQLNPHTEHPAAQGKEIITDPAERLVQWTFFLQESSEGAVPLCIWMVNKETMIAAI